MPCCCIALKRDSGGSVHPDRVGGQVGGSNVGLRACGDDHTRCRAGQANGIICARSRCRNVDDGKAVSVFQHNVARRGNVFLDRLVQQRHGGSAIDIVMRRDTICANALQDAHFRQRRHIACRPDSGFAAIRELAQVRGGVRCHPHRAGEHGHGLLTGDRRGRVNVSAVALQNTRCGAAQDGICIPFAAIQIVIAVLRLFGQAEHAHENRCQLAAGERTVGLKGTVRITLYDALLHPTVDRGSSPAVRGILHKRLILRGKGGN